MKSQFLIFSFLILDGLIRCRSSEAQQNTSLKNYTLQVCEKVKDPSRQAGTINTDSLSNLPIGIVKEINNRKYIIAVDSAYFLPAGAYFNAYAAIEFPGSDQQLAFAAKNIRFNPSGVIGGSLSKLMLVSDHVIPIGPNTELHLKADGDNYVEWDCNGFTSINLGGEFRFTNELFVPAEVSNEEYVSAHFSIHANDIHNMITNVSFSPFRIRGIDDLEFNVQNAIVDWSDFSNDPAMIFPTGYMNENNSPLWKGFFIKQFRIKLPSQLNRNNSPSEISAQNLIIDDAGISGNISMMNVFFPG